MGIPNNDSTPIVAAAGIGATRHIRSRVLKPADINPANTKSRSPATPCSPNVTAPSPPITTSPRADQPRSYELLPQYQCSEKQAAQCSARRLNHTSVSERYEQKTRISDNRESRSAQ